MKKLFVMLAISIASSSLLADEAQEQALKKAIAALKEGIELLEDNQIDDGAEEIRWGLELIDKAKQSGIDKYLIDEVGEFKGGEIVKNKAMGVSITERVYTNEAGDKITVTLTRMAADGGAGGGFLAGLGGLANLGMMQGERVRYGGVVGSAMKQGREYAITLPFDDASSNLKIAGNVEEEVADTFARGYAIRELNDAVSTQ